MAANVPLRRVLAGTLSLVVPVALLALFALRRWDQLGPYPTGLDAGNWLAFGRGMFGEGKSTAGVYPPVIPGLLTTAARLGHPLEAARLLSVGTLLMPPLAVYLVSRPFVGPWFGLAAATLVACARPFGEAAAYGGYPQNAAIGLAVLASGSFARYLEGGASRYLAGAAGLVVGVAATHHLYLIAVLAWVVAILGLWWLARPRVLLRRRGLVGAAVLLVVGITSGLPLAYLLVREEFSPPFNASDSGIWDSWVYTAGGALPGWSLLIVLGAAGLYASHGSPRLRAPWLVAASGSSLGLAGFLVTQDARILPLAIIAAAMGAALGLETLRARLAGTAIAGLPVAAPIAALILVPISDDRAAEDFNYYRVLNADMVATIDWVDAQGGTVVVRENARGWPVGWWYEGLSTARVIVGSDLRWLGYPEEQRNATLAGRFFAHGTSAAQVRSLAAEQGVDYLVFSKDDWNGWTDWIRSSPPLPVVFENGTFMALDVRAAR